MNKCVVILLLVFAFNPLLAQNDAVISGSVLSKPSKEPLPYATVSILSEKDRQVVAGTITDDNGRFTFAGMATGKYVVSFSFLGYEPKEIPLLVGDLNKVFDLGKIMLTPSSKQLDEVTVAAQKEIVSAALDKKSFEIDNNISQSGGSVLDAMRNLPGVTIDPEGKVILRGSDNVSVLIDGKQSSLTGFSNQKGLDNIPATNVDHIEIINNPSAKYNAAGMAGIINIVYKQEKDSGLNGEVGLNVGVGELTQRRSNLPDISEKYAQTPKLNPTLNLNYRQQKANIFLQADGIVRKRVNANEFIRRDYQNQRDISSQFLENRTQQLYNIKGGVDWFLNESNTLTVFTLWQDEYHIDRGDVPYDYAESGERKRMWGWAEDERTNFINYSANYTHKFAQPGHEISLQYLYTGGGEDELFSFTDSSATRNSVDETFLTVYEYVNNFTVDYVNPLKAGRLELGFKISLRNIPITYTIRPGQNSILDPGLGDWSEYEEDIYAFYGNYIWQKPKLDLEAGMRFEPTFVQYQLDPENLYYQNNAYQYFPLFPNMRFTYNLSDKNTVSLFYNRRLDRPGEFEVRPFPKYDDPEILKTGNPNLRPQFTQNFELGYKRYWNSGSAYISGFYRLIDGFISRVYTSDTTQNTIVHTIPQNLGKGTNLGFELAMDQAITENWKLNGSFNWYRNHINAFSGKHIYPYEQPFDFAASTANTWNLKVNSTLTLPGQIDFQLTSVYYAPNIIPQGSIGDRYSLDIGLKKQVLDSRGELLLAATDLLNTFQIEQEIKGADFNLTSTNYYETQVVTLGFKYKFYKFSKNAL